MGYRPLRFCRITNPFAAPDSYASRTDGHGRAGHHTGIDFGMALVPRLIRLEGKPVRSSTAGTVVISEFETNSEGVSTMGNWVGVYNAVDDVLITYWHMKGRRVEVGDVVKRGTILGHVGSTGNSTAPHLHVQANHGRVFDYHAHIAPGTWVRGPLWARLVRDETQRGRRKRKPFEGISPK